MMRTIGYVLAAWLGLTSITAAQVCPLAPANSNDTRCASTAYVTQQLALFGGVAYVGQANTFTAVQTFNAAVNVVGQLQFNGSAGTSTTVAHGNPSGPPSWGQVVAGDVAAGVAASNVGALGGDLTGTLPNPAVGSAAITNAKMAAGSANTVKGSLNGTSEVDLPVGNCSGTSQGLNYSSGTGFGCGTPGGTILPQGRLTLTSGTPVMTASVTGASTLYYTPAAGRYVPVWNGSGFVNIDIGGELSQATTDTTKSPAAVAASQLYDVFVWVDSGTPRSTRGPAYALTGVRGSGAGTSQLTLLQGVLVNAVSITNGPGANLGTYVGTVASDGSSLLDMSFGGAGVNGVLAQMNVWNAYNQVLMLGVSRDTSGSWTVASGTTQMAHASATNRVQFTYGLQVSAIQGVVYNILAGQIPASNFCVVGFSLDSTTAPIDHQASDFNTSASAVEYGLTVPGNYAPVIGQHYIQAMESDSGTGSCTLNGTSSNPQGLEVPFLG